MSDSILTSTKKVCNIGEDYTVFDQDFIMYINTVLSTLNQLGIGPVDGFVIENDTQTWTDFLGADKRMNQAKTYVHLRVRMLFDPPTTSYHIQAIQEQIKELEWRLNVVREGDAWVDPDPVLVSDIDYPLEGW